MNCKCHAEVFETKRMVNNWEQYTGKFRLTLHTNEGSMYVYRLPGKGGPKTQRTAEEIHELYHEGKTIADITRITGCECVQAV